MTQRWARPVDHFLRASKGLISPTDRRCYHDRHRGEDGIERQSWLRLFLTLIARAPA